MRRVVQQQILDSNGWEGHKAWAFGLGLERLAMIKFAINDIRLFWSPDSRFTSQFRAGDLNTQFKPYSKFPPCFKACLSLQCCWLSHQSMSACKLMPVEPCPCCHCIACSTAACKSSSAA